MTQLPSRINLSVIQGIDSAWTTRSSSDWSVVLTAGTDGVFFYILDLFRARLEYYDLKQAVVDQYRKHLPDGVVCEEASSGYALISELRNSTGIAIVGRKPIGSKGARASAVSPLYEAGKVLLPRYAPWVEEFIREHVRFGSHPHDDIVDAATLALTELRGLVRRQASSSRGSLGWRRAL